ncbi:conserved hypothetical protein [Rippkaea orientalis PCC 8801]|uniref:Lipoprotein n=1 Tax=Rippkaea orientalis (strain PCC 8801 / RF-1) TaxID=41431 RepID=B7JZE5_RIPO1|nr:hypothetical protein [Rippkaea orientalis]ACK67356.1 conserved hypothetical protein [Rippkaea orientalis PCC 8801]
MLVKLRKILVIFLISSLVLLTACAKQPPSRFEQAQQESTQRGVSAVVRESVTGGSLNRFFPPAGDGYERVYTQEKKGFAEAKLKKDGQEVAVMAIADILNTPNAAAKFEQSSQKIGGYPAVQQGKTGTAVLVANRFQVKVLSRDASFTESDRQTWLEKFDLNGLANLKQ